MFTIHLPICFPVESDCDHGETQYLLFFFGCEIGYNIEALADFLRSLSFDKRCNLSAGSNERNYILSQKGYAKSRRGWIIR